MTARLSTSAVRSTIAITCTVAMLACTVHEACQRAGGVRNRPATQRAPAAVERVRPSRQGAREDGGERG